MMSEAGEDKSREDQRERWRRVGWKRLLLGLFLVLVVAFAVIQAVPYGRDHTNPPVATSPAWASPATEQLFAVACADCHSNLTRWPWYTSVAPFSWLAQRDVEDGRDEFNVSELGRGEVEIEELAEVIRDGSIPPWQYTLTHRDARLSDQQKETLINGLSSTFAGTASQEED